jgi:hypothetical protein
MEKIEILTTILFVGVLGSINSLLSYFLDYCFWEGSIFGRWLPFIAKINLKLFDSDKFKGFQSAKDNPHYDNMLVEQAQKLFFFKILGGCPLCTNIWLGFFTFTIIALSLSISFWYSLPYLLISSAVLRRILK